MLLSYIGNGSHRESFLKIPQGKKVLSYTLDGNYDFCVGKTYDCCFSCFMLRDQHKMQGKPSIWTLEPQLSSLSQLVSSIIQPLGPLGTTIATSLPKKCIFSSLRNQSEQKEDCVNHVTLLISFADSRSFFPSKKSYKVVKLRPFYILSMCLSLERIWKFCKTEKYVVL